MQIRYYLNVETSLPHIYDHDVSEAEVQGVLRKPLEEIHGRRDSIVAIGQTRHGRHLKVIYARDQDAIFVITAYESFSCSIARFTTPTSAEAKMKKDDPNHYPKGWTGKKVREVIAHYENQSHQDATAEAEAAYRKSKSALLEMPVK